MKFQQKNVVLVSSLCQSSIARQKGAVEMKRYFQYPRWHNRRMNGTMWRTAKFEFRGSSQKSNSSWAVEQFKNHVWLFAMARLCFCLGQLTWLSRWSAFLFASVTLAFSENTVYLVICPAYIFLWLTLSDTFLLTFLFLGPQLCKSLLCKQWTLDISYSFTLAWFGLE